MELVDLVNLTPLIQAFLAVLTAIAVPRVISWLNAKTTAEQRTELREWVKIAVAAAEQLYNTGDGAAKKKYVVDFLTERGFTLEFDELNNTIEAAVLELHQSIRNSECGIRNREKTGEAES